MEINEISSAIEAILFASGEPVPASRIAQVLGVSEEKVMAAAAELAAEYEKNLRGIRLLRLEDKLQLCSAAEYSQLITMALETRKPPRLSPSALEVLAIVAYYQPATKAMVEQIRGVDSAYSISALLNKKLIEEAGRLNVPGRPILYRTTPDFLRTFGISSLEELPPIEKVSFGEPVMADEPAEVAEEA